MSEIEAIVLGIIQGLTEFLPVSSSGHIELGKAVMGTEIEDDLAFSVIVHFATMLSTVVIFRKNIWLIITELFRLRWNEHTQLATWIVVSMLPVMFIGLFFESEIEQLFEGQIILVGCMLLVTAVLLYLTTLIRPAAKPLNFPRAFFIGIAQAIAVLPGISRSGATISTGLMLGVDKVRVTTFSFLMVLPPIAGATLIKLRELSGAEKGTLQLDWLPLLLGFAAAFVAGLFACKWMIHIVRKGKLIWFAGYCLIIGLLAISWGLFG